MKLRPAPTLDAFDAAKVEYDQKLQDVGRGNILLGYQGRAIKAVTQFALTVIEKSRRIGLTWGLAFQAVLTAARKGYAGRKVWYMGFEKDMTREFIDACAMWAKAMNFAIEDSGEVVLEDEEKHVTAFVITFPSGNKITALPAVARAWRGKKGFVIIDESAFMSNLEEVLKAALALTMWGDKVVVVSTHNGIDNPFNKLIQEIRAKKREGEVITITLADALADGLYERIKLLNPDIPDKAEWERALRARYGDNAAEELDCIPKVGGGSWLKAEDITKCEHADAGKPELYQGGLCYIGRDIARRRHWAVIWVFELVGNILWLRERWEKIGATFAEQEEAFDDMMHRYRIAEADIDQTGMGEAVVEAAITKHGPRVKGVLFAPGTRLTMATLLAERFQNGTIRIPYDDEIRVDLRGIKQASNDNKALAEAADVHPDRFWAAGLACLAAHGMKIEYGYTPVGALKAGANDDFNSRHGGHLDRGETRHGMSKGGGAW
ncbi:terminase-like family protein [Asticcacaulis biprosthecium C19]|uniref:Terminase-like family protein n=1 Tax=Asticcacaulis biprosthecium C19 TaxID=715226 RepID=F4QGB0_9CAUL|nr:terminase family protein [Asticcacaulis biprosthecium]EGF92438.1 terminase-like family protein [Asticcacaulis biprosthecium C19]